MAVKPQYPIVDGPIAGEAWAFAPRTMPWDRPAQHSELDTALNVLFSRLRSPVMSKKLLNLAAAGMPLDMLAESVLMDGFLRGSFGAPILPQMVPPLIVIMWRMCESAGIKPQLSTDKGDKVDFDPTALANSDAAIGNNTANRAIRANEQSDSELKRPNLADRQGFIKFRPKAKSK